VGYGPNFLGKMISPTMSKIAHFAKKHKEVYGINYMIFHTKASGLAPP
jgi:hypothetical protein